MPGGLIACSAGPGRKPEVFTHKGETLTRFQLGGGRFIIADKQRRDPKDGALKLSIRPARVSAVGLREQENVQGGRTSHINRTGLERTFIWAFPSWGWCGGVLWVGESEGQFRESRPYRRRGPKPGAWTSCEGKQLFKDLLSTREK